MDLIADTTLLVGLWRGQPWAKTFAQENATRSLGLPWIVLGEFWHGATRAGHSPELVQSFLTIGVPLLDPGPVIPLYAKICAQLQETTAYRTIGQNDLWIAAVSLSLAKPLVTRHVRHFDKIEGLRLVVLQP